MKRLGRIPAHLKQNPPRLFLLRRWADVLAARFDASVYLVGSALRDDNYEPRDWDVRVPLTYEQFALRYATREQRASMTPRSIAELWNEEYYGRASTNRMIYWRWHKEAQHVAKEAYRRYVRLNIDFQVYPPSEWRAWGDAPYWKLSTRHIEAPS